MYKIEAFANKLLLWLLKFKLKIQWQNWPVSAVLVGLYTEIQNTNSCYISMLAFI